MPATITITTSKGTFDFSTYDLPLVSRRINNVRKGNTGQSIRTVELSLSGFFRGAQHSDVVNKYQALSNILSAGDGRITYNDGAADVLNNQKIYIDNLNEPSDWKQYSGEYAISMHYFSYVTYTSQMPIAASYSSPLGSIAFEKTPQWQSTKKHSRSDPFGLSVTPSGALIGLDTRTSLSGFLEADNHSDLRTKIDNLESALKADGTLNYGDWSDDVRVIDFSIPSIYPENYVEFTVNFAYKTANVRKFSSRATYERLHSSPIIRHRPYCPSLGPHIQTFPNYQTGQTVDYSIKIWSDDVSAARTLLANEAANLIQSGGIEMQGGTETRNYDDGSVGINVKKWYSTPILSNLAGS